MVNSSNFNIYWCNIRQNRYTDRVFPNDLFFVPKYIFSLALFHTSEQQVTLSNHLNSDYGYTRGANGSAIFREKRLKGGST
jgi:hypothetical protein